MVRLLIVVNFSNKEKFTMVKVDYSNTTWSGFPNSRGDTSAELGGVSYSGLGGLDVSPPLSWIFEPNFLLSFPAESVHIMRYKDVHDRMEISIPVFPI